jgi:TonB family protein
MIVRLVLLLGCGAGAFAMDLFSDWKGTLETNGRPVPVYLKVTRQDGKLTGSIATGTDAKFAPIDRLAVDGETLTFEVRDNAGRLVHFRLTLSGDQLSGESKVGDETSKAILSRAGGGGWGSRGPLTSRPAEPSREGVCRVGGGVSAPALLEKTEPEYTEQARAARYQGTVLLYIEIDPTGKATNIKVQRGLGLGLDEKAIEAVSKWKFKPGQKDGAPVTVQATIEVNFRL